MPRLRPSRANPSDKVKILRAAFRAKYGAEWSRDPVAKALFNEAKRALTKGSTAARAPQKVDPAQAPQQPHVASPPTRKKSSPAALATELSSRLHAPKPTRMRAAVFAAQHLGKVRERQEDTFLAAPRVIGVFDGMGGMAKGDVASAIARDRMAQAAQEIITDASGYPVHVVMRQALTEAFNDADREIHRVVRRGGTTAVVAAIEPDGYNVLIGHLGDSRAYRWRPSSSKLTQLTQDHQHPGNRFIVLKALSGNGDQVEFTKASLTPGDLLMLCSDGLNSELTEDQISDVLRSGPADPAAALVAATLTTEAKDNVTVVVYRAP